MTDGIQGPSNNRIEADLKLPDCIQIKTKEDEQEFYAFLAKVVNTAREAWNKERR